MRARAPSKEAAVVQVPLPTHTHTITPLDLLPWTMKEIQVYKSTDDLVSFSFLLLRFWHSPHLLGRVGRFSVGPQAFPRIWASAAIATRVTYFWIITAAPGPCRVKEDRFIVFVMQFQNPSSTTFFLLLHHIHTW